MRARRRGVPCISTVQCSPVKMDTAPYGIGLYHVILTAWPGSTAGLAEPIPTVLGSYIRLQQWRPSCSHR